ncbi:hypothetical protein [Ferriphaselus sp. R-1]|uniref:hypothetical protein n=1 Tax=Ferriphaselus sp. R-1 TaxID=1485544 RepID=UPI001267AC9E|nr:hypothetical protein [Ferriphaselus sp. R-1]
MIKLDAKPVETGIPFLQGSEIVRIEYALGNLQAFVRDISLQLELVIIFSDVIGFRVLDERDLMEFWPECSIPKDLLFEIYSGGWLSQEASRPGSCIDPMNPAAKEYFVKGVDDCLSVICHSAPEIRNNAP